MLNTCPHCKTTHCLPLWRKLCLGPTAMAHCQVCGYLVGVDVARACIAMSPTFLLIIVASLGLLRAPVTLVVLLVACLVAMFTLYAFWVPLKPAELTNAAMVEAGRARKAALRS